MSKKVDIALDDELYQQAAEFAACRGWKVGKNPGVATVIRTALAAYLSKYGAAKKEKGKENG